MFRAFTGWLRRLSGQPAPLILPAQREAPEAEPPVEIVAVPPEVRQGDEVARQVYADMLESEGRMLEREWLSVEQLLWVAPVAEQDALRSQLAQIPVSPGFRAAVTRSHIENCSEQPCHACWEHLSMTERARVRRCGTCSSEVHFADTASRARALLHEGKRVAFSPEIDSSTLEAAGLPWSEFVARYPRWSDAAQTCAPFAGAVKPLALEPHPLFSPWQDELSGWPVGVALAVPAFPGAEPWEPTADDSFARGHVAFLEDEAWPTCAGCARGLELCVQLAPSAMAGWLGEGRGLVVMYCFHCREVGNAFVREVRTRVRVAAPSSAVSEWNPPEHQAQAVRVEVGSPTRSLPSTAWFRVRSEVTPDTAASALFGFDSVELEHPVSENDWDAWASSDRGLLPDFLGGVANWDQGDRTPRCQHGEMLHLLDFNGGQFLDAALHVFLCPARSCALASVAEF